MQALLTCLSVLSLMGQSGVANQSAEDWLYIGDAARLVSFEVTVEVPGDKGVFVPGQRSGFILLNKDSFYVSCATPFNSTYSTYENGVLKLTRTGDLSTKSETVMTYRSALLATLDDSVCQELSGLVPKVLANGERNAPLVSSLQIWNSGVKSRAEFGKSWRAMKRFKAFLPDPEEPRDERHIVCVFRVILPKKR